MIKQWRTKMMGLPNWLRNREGDFDMTHDEDMTVPQIAKVEPKLVQMSSGTLPVPDDHEANVVVQAHQFVEQWKIERVAQQKLIDELRTKLAEVMLQLKSEERKSGLLELDIAERDNTIQTLQSDVLERKRLLDMLKDINDKTSAAFARLGVTGEPKKERKSNAKAPKKKASVDRKEADQLAEEIRTAQEKHNTQ